MYKSQSGNVIFYILIAVALLAALSYVVSGSLRGGGKAVGAERQLLNASEIIEYGNILSGAITQARLRGHEDIEISFENSEVTGYANTNCDEAECKIFDVDGGGVSYMAPKQDWLDGAQKAQARHGEFYFNATSNVKEVGTASDDLLVILPYISKDLCMAINQKLGIEPPSTETPIESNGPAAMNVKFTGTFDTVANTEISGAATTGNATILNGQTAGCTASSGGGSNPPTGTYHYYQVLIAH